MKTVKRKFKGQRALVSGLTLLLMACGSDDDGSAAGVNDLPGLAVNGLGGRLADEVTAPWLATIRTFRRESVTPGTGDAEISTLQYTDQRTVQRQIDFYGAQVELDTCVIATEGDSDSDGGNGNNGSSVPYVSGGGTVAINAPNGTWFTIDEGDTGNYEVNNTLPGAIPSGASLSIPGDLSFPSVAAFPITEPPAPIRTAPQTDDISVESEYRWQAVGGRGVYLRLSFIEYDAAGDFVGFPIGCNLADDGMFELPAEVLFAISNTSNRLEARYTRRSRSINVIDAVVVYSRISVAE